VRPHDDRRRLHDRRWRLRALWRDDGRRRSTRGRLLPDEGRDDSTRHSMGWQSGEGNVIGVGPTRALPDRLAHQLFEEQARAGPDRVAAVHGDQQLTYGELNSRANQLARVLLARG